MITRKSSLLAPCLALVFALPAMPQAFPGSIFTSLNTGIVPNANIYEFREDVYLNGGPQNQNASGLPLGLYYFQVTNPSGSVLLSTSKAACRIVQVQPNSNGQGVIFGIASDADRAGCNNLALHPNGVLNPANGGIPVQLFPYSFTPNMGGEYKAWLIPQTGVIPGCTTNVVTQGGYKALDFNCSKTDNFKVRDRNGNGGPDVFDISGVKFFDVDMDGVQDPEDFPIAGWRIHITGVVPGNGNNGGPFDMVTETNINGQWGLTLLPAETTFVACELFPEEPWEQTYPDEGDMNPDGDATANADRCWEGTIVDKNITGLDFGNFCTEARAKTPGFWSNNNGEAILAAHDEDWRDLLNDLHLTNQACGDFDVMTGVDFLIAYPEFRDWLLDGNAVNMSYMLSVHLAAMTLNVNYLDPAIPPDAPVFTGPAPAGCDIPDIGPTGFITVQDLLDDADAELEDENCAFEGVEPERTCQEFKKTALDLANNNLNIIIPCTVTYLDPL